MGKGSSKTTTQDQSTTQAQNQFGQSSQGIDQASQDYITNFLRPLGQDAVTKILGLGSTVPGTNATFQQGVGGVQQALRGAQGYQNQINQFQQGLGGIGGALQRFDPRIGELGFNQTAIDPAQANQLFQASLKAGRAGKNPANFDPNSVRNFFNPYEQQVVGSVQANADRQREQALSRAASEATSRGAFGGSRSGVLQAESLRNVNQDEAAQVAQLRNQGFQSAQQAALQAHGIDTNADIAGRAQQLQALSTGLGAADLTQRGQIASNQIGLGAAKAAQQGRIAQGQLGLGRAEGLQAGQIAAGNLGLGGLGLGLQGLGQQAAFGQQLAGLGEAERQVLQQQQQEPYQQQQLALQLANLGYGGPLGSTQDFATNSTSVGRTTGTTKETTPGNLFGDLLGTGLAVGGLLLGGPAGGAAASGLSSKLNFQAPDPLTLGGVRYGGGGAVGSGLSSVGGTRYGVGGGGGQPVSASGIGLQLPNFAF